MWLVKREKFTFSSKKCPAYRSRWNLPSRMELPQRELIMYPVTCGVVGMPHGLEPCLWPACIMGFTQKGPALATRLKQGSLKIVFRVLPLPKILLVTHPVHHSPGSFLSIKGFFQIRGGLESMKTTFIGPTICPASMNRPSCDPLCLGCQKNIGQFCC